MLKRTSFILFALTLSMFMTDAQAQIQTPRPSPLAKVSQNLALTDVEVTYSRPGVKGRKIFGDIVAYGEMWRTGANDVTLFSVADDVSINGSPLAAGKYALLTIPGEKEWTVIFSKDNEMGGVADYVEANDALRTRVRPRLLSETAETFTISFSDFKDEGATMTLFWENTAIDLSITMDVDSKIEAAIKATLIDSKEEAKAGDYHAAAVYYMGKNKNLDQALTWMEKSVELRPAAFWYVHRHAELLGQMGRTEEAIKTAEQSKKMASEYKDGDFGYIKRNDDLIAKLKGN
jgi:hypothetical protein